jgi:hypothetical protein
LTRAEQEDGPGFRQVVTDQFRDALTNGSSDEVVIHTAREAVRQADTPDPYRVPDEMPIAWTDRSESRWFSPNGSGFAQPDHPRPKLLALKSNQPAQHETPSDAGTTASDAHSGPDDVSTPEQPS